MSARPSLSRSQSRRQRELARKRRAHIRRRTTAFVLLVLAGTLLWHVLGAGGRTGHGGHPRPKSAPPSRVTHAAHPPTVLATPLPAHSPIGLTLGRPPLTLRVVPAAGVSLRVGFRVPPRAGVLFNLDSGRVIWQRAPLQRMPIASLTKLMTALLVVERTKPHTRALITKQAVDFQGSGMGVLPLGKHVGVKALLAGLLLPSGNDAAIALAQHVAGSVPAFVALMNRRAAALGLGCTRYSSPSGYYDHDNYSCAADLAQLAAIDIRQPRIASLTGHASVVVPFPIKGGHLYVNTNNPLVALGYPGATGLKTGYTSAAGLCLVETAQRGGVRLGLVLLHSPNAAAQAERLLDDGFQDVYHLPHEREPKIATVTVSAPPPERS